MTYLINKDSTLKNMTSICWGGGGDRSALLPTQGQPFQKTLNQRPRSAMKCAMTRHAALGCGSIRDVVAIKAEYDWENTINCLSSGK